MITAIRIEHPDSGYGIWRAQDREWNDIIDRSEFSVTLTKRHGGGNFLTPWNDGIKFVSGKHYCAFKSMGQLYQWVFPEEIKDLIRIGFCVYLLELSEALEGNFQYCYEKQHILTKTDISSLF